jgi:SAM-dependent methyltransferase
MTFRPEVRVHQPELLDLGTVPDDEVRESLGDLRRVNRWLGGRRVLARLLDEQVRRTGLRTFTLLDAGTGSGDLPEFVARRYGARVVGLDRQLLHLREGRGGWTPVCGEMRELPFAPRSFDFVAASLVLHHFADNDAADLLARLATLARRALLVNDLERSAWAWRFVRYAPLFSAVSREDGMISVQQAFTAAELQALAARAGLSRVRVRRHVPFRLSLVSELS